MPVPDYGISTPVNEQIAADLRGQIEAAKIGIGERLPSNKALAGHYHVAAETIRKALRELRDQGVIATQSTRGTFVVRKPGPPGEPSPEFTKIMERLDGMEAEIRRQAARIEELEQERQRLRGQ